MNNQSIPASAAAITPSDTTNQHGLGLYVGVAGNVALEMSGSNVTFVGVQAGSMLPLEFNKVLATGTTASSLVRVW